MTSTLLGSLTILSVLRHQLEKNKAELEPARKLVKKDNFRLLPVGLPLLQLLTAAFDEGQARYAVGACRADKYPAGTQHLP